MHSQHDRNERKTHRPQRKVHLVKLPQYLVALITFTLYKMCLGRVQCLKVRQDSNACGMAEAQLGITRTRSPFSFSAEARHPCRPHARFRLKRRLKLPFEKHVEDLHAQLSVIRILAICELSRNKWRIDPQGQNHGLLHPEPVPRDVNNMKAWFFGSK